MALFPSMGSAQPQTGQRVALAWHAPVDADCSSDEQMRERVGHLSNRPLVQDTSDADARIRVDVIAHEGSWQAEVTLAVRPDRVLGVRRVQGRSPSCGSIDVAAAVVIATMLDGLPAPAPATPPAPSADGGGLGLGIFGAASPGVVPEAFVGGGLELALNASLQLVFSASAYVPAEHTDERGRGARIWAAHAGLGLCPAIVRSEIAHLRICANLQGGAAFASGIGLTQSTSAAVPLMLVQLGPKLTLRLTERVAIWLSVAGAVVAARPTIHWDVAGQPEQVLRAGRIALLAQIGMTISP